MSLMQALAAPLVARFIATRRALTGCRCQSVTVHHPSCPLRGVR